jgi:hypothetical protein
MRIESVVTSVNYGDLLAWTLPHNKNYFENTVVVTTPEDQETQKVCDYWHVRYIVTDAFHTETGFNKGAGINAGLNELSCKDWIVHWDADIFMPPLTRYWLEQNCLDETCIYGTDRMNCTGFQNWIQFLQNPKFSNEQDVFVHFFPYQFAMGSRICRSPFGGYVPIGFFQLWHGSQNKNTYPTHHEHAARSDVLFATEWPRGKRHLIPEIICIHLETGKNEMGANWWGRKTPKFGASLVEGEIQSPVDLKTIDTMETSGTI